MSTSKTNRTLLRLLGAILLSSFAHASESFPYSDYDLQGNARGNLDEEGPDGRLFFVLNNATTASSGLFVTFNTTVLLLSVGTLLWGIAGGLALYYFLTTEILPTGTGYSDYEHTGGYDGRKFSGSFDPYAINWEKFNIIDWISIGEEAYEKFNPSDLDCQKRLICEVHQNTDKFGPAAARMVDLFSYLQYTEVLSLPEEFKALVDEYLDAAARGRSVQKDCGVFYDSCDFSVKKMVEKFNHNEI